MTSTLNTKLVALTHLFQTAGAPDPAGWARSELNEDIPQLARFLFLRQAWRSVVSRSDRAWIDSEIAHARERPDAPGSGIGPALERLLECGCARDDLTEVVRTMQWQLLFALCYLLSDPDIPEPALAHVNWALVEVDDDGTIGRHIGGLHESVLETDPSGQEMRPQPAV